MNGLFTSLWLRLPLLPLRLLLVDGRCFCYCTGVAFLGVQEGFAGLGFCLKVWDLLLSLEGENLLLEIVVETIPR
jgi:hypothetical protein